MYSNPSMLDLPSCGVDNQKHMKKLMKKKLINDMLVNDCPDPWFAQQQIKIAADQLPWLAPPTHRPLPPLPTSTSVPMATSLSSSPSLPSKSTLRKKRPHSAETIMKWMDQRLAQQQQPVQQQQQQQQQQQRRMRIPSSPSTLHSSVSSSPTTSPTTPTLSPQFLPATAPPSNVRRASTRRCSSRRSSSTNPDRVLNAFPTISKPATPTPSTPPVSNSSSGSGSKPSSPTIAPQLTRRRGSSQSKRNKYDMTEWPSVLSTDANESDRLVAQHYILRTAYEQDFSAPVRATLERGNAVVLDMGCGPGTWAMEMATVFPRSTFVGIDQRAQYPRDIKPKNCHFRQYDLTQPLPLPDNCIDYIFQRDLNWSLPAHQWALLMAEYLRVLKPGGWIELVEQDAESQSSGPNECALNDRLLSGLSMRGQDPHAARRLAAILAVAGFRRAESQFQSLPLGWGQSHAANSNSSTSAFAKAVASHYAFTLRSLQPWLAAVMSITPDKYEQSIEQLPSEWRQTNAYVNWYCATAQKPYR